MTLTDAMAQAATELGQCDVIRARDRLDPADQTDYDTAVAAGGPPIVQVVQALQDMGVGLSYTSLSWHRTGDCQCAITTGG